MENGKRKRHHRVGKRDACHCEKTNSTLESKCFVSRHVALYTLFVAVVFVKGILIGILMAKE